MLYKLIKKRLSLEEGGSGSPGGPGARTHTCGSPRDLAHRYNPIRAVAPGTYHTAGCELEEPACGDGPWIARETPMRR